MKAIYALTIVIIMITVSPACAQWEFTPQVAFEQPYRDLKWIILKSKYTPRYDCHHLLLTSYYLHSKKTTSESHPTPQPHLAPRD